MSGLPEPTRGADHLVPPADSGVHAGTATTTTTTAANLDTTVDAGGCYLTIQARGGDVYVRFKATASTAATTSGDGSNGLKIPDGQERHFWVIASTRYVDHICSAASKTLFWWKSSPNYNDR